MYTIFNIDHAIPVELQTFMISIYGTMVTVIKINMSLPF